MKFPKSPQSLIETFNAVMPGPPARTRKMFGYPSGFVNGNMFIGLFGEQMFLRLPSESREQLKRTGGKSFEPMPGRPMRDYVVLPPSLISDRDQLTKLIAESFKYSASLPAKTKPAKKRTPGSAGRRR
jgi:TfoX/Sxy family transcriptional regulator of competence genes